MCKNQDFLKYASRPTIVNLELEDLADTHTNVLEYIKKLEAAIYETIEENLHLADGDNCTLIKLKRSINYDQF